MEKRSLTLNGLTGMHALQIFISLGMIAVSFYLTVHYFNVRFPTQIGGSATLCDLSNFWNCDAATHSKMADIFNVPTSIYGLIVGMLFFFSSLMPSEAQEKTCSAVSKYNFIGCIFFFIYSLTSLSSLCPFCTLYYILSGLACLNYAKFGINSWVPDIKVGAIWAIILASAMTMMSMQKKEKQNLQTQVNVSIVEQYKALADLGDPQQDSPYVIHKSSKPFKDHPIRVTIFSDFQCPFCKLVAEQMPKLIRRYKEKIAIQYIFFPLDSACNSNMKSRAHDKACAAAMLAGCDPQKFVEIHDEIFRQQEHLSAGGLEKIAESYNLTSCLTSEEMKNKVIANINFSIPYNIASTPTLLINGKKIEGSLPESQFEAIFDHLLNYQE